MITQHDKQTTKDSDAFKEIHDSMYFHAKAVKLHGSKGLNTMSLNRGYING